MLLIKQPVIDVLQGMYRGSDLEGALKKMSSDLRGMFSFGPAESYLVRGESYPTYSLLIDHDVKDNSVAVVIASYEPDRNRQVLRTFMQATQIPLETAMRFQPWQYDFVLGDLNRLENARKLQERVTRLRFG